MGLYINLEQILSNSIRFLQTGGKGVAGHVVCIFTFSQVFKTFRSNKQKSKRSIVFIYLESYQIRCNFSFFFVHFKFNKM